MAAAPLSKLRMVELCPAAAQGEGWARAGAASDNQRTRNQCHQKQTNMRATKYYLQAKNISAAGFA